MYTSYGWCVNWWNIKWRGRECLGQMELGLSAKQYLSFSSCVLWTVSLWHPVLLILVWCQLLSLPWSTYLVWATLDSLVVSLLVIFIVKQNKFRIQHVVASRKILMPWYDLMLHTFLISFRYLQFGFGISRIIPMIELFWQHQWPKVFFFLLIFYFFVD